MEKYPIGGDVGEPAGVPGGGSNGQFLKIVANIPTWYSLSPSDRSSFSSGGVWCEL